MLVEARKQTRMLRELQADVKEIRADLKILLDNTHRIDVNVAQGHLREGLKHALRSATHEDEVDLVVLARLTDEALHLFYPSVGGPVGVGCGRGLVLASDVRELAESAMHLLFAARRTALEAHNLGCAGDPARVVRDDHTSTTFTRVAETAALLVTNEHRASEMGDEVRRHLHQSWSFIGDTGWYRRLVRRNLAERLEEDLGLLREVPVAKALLDELSEDEPLKDAGGRGPSAVADIAIAYCDAWVAKSDAGLLRRLAQGFRCSRTRSTGPN